MMENINIRPINVVKWRLRGFSEEEAITCISKGISLVQALKEKNPDRQKERKILDRGLGERITFWPERRREEQET